VRIPDGLGGDAVAVAIDLALEYMHLFHVAVATDEEYRKTYNPSGTGPSPAQKIVQLAKVPLAIGMVMITVGFAMRLAARK
jgi:hypothetical protein